MSEIATRSEAYDRAHRIRIGLVSIASTLADVKAAWADRDWEALGYNSWAAYVEGEFGEHRVPMLSREQRREIVAELRDSSMSTRAIGAVLGVDQATVSRDLSTGDANASPADEQKAVTGTDGKTYTATRPSPPPEPRPEPAPDLLAGDDWTEPDPEPLPGPSARQAPIVTRDTTVDDQEQSAAYARLDAELDAAMEGTEVRFRRNYASAAVKAGEIVHFDPDRLAEIYAGNWDRNVGDLVRRLTDWCEQVREARRRHQRAGLRVVGGGASE